MQISCIKNSYLFTIFTIARYGYVWNGHIMFIYIYIYIYIYIIEHMNLEIRKTRNDFSVRVQNFLWPLSLKVLRREIHILSTLAFSSVPPPPSRVTPAQGLREQAKDNRLLPRQVSTLLTDFFKIPKSSARFRCVTSLALASLVSHLGHCDIFEWHVCSSRARVNTCAQVCT